MDTATTALLTVAAAEFGKGTIREVAKDAYVKTKTWIAGRLAALGRALTGLEEDHGSEAQKGLVKEKAAALTQVAHEPEFQQLVAALRSAMENDPAGKPALQAALQVAIGTGAIAAGKIGTVIQGGVSGGLTIHSAD